MSNRNTHLFQFTAQNISQAAMELAVYHREREEYWQKEFDTSLGRVTETAGVKVEKFAVTGGWRAEVMVNYGDPAAYHRMNEAACKIQEHSKLYDHYRREANLYATQGVRNYDLDPDDVQFFRLNGAPRED